MNPYFSMKGGKALALLSLVMLLSACEYGLDVPEDQERKTLFEVDDARPKSIVRSASCRMPGDDSLIPQDTSNTSAMLRISLRDFSADEALIGRLEMFKPFAAYYLNEIAKAKKNGVAFDLRSDKKQTAMKEEFSLEKEGAFSLPVTILWDKDSAPRLKNITAKLNGLPGISARNITQENLNIKSQENTQNEN